jgi:agmatinase
VSYRPGARFGPRAIRAASQRQTAFRSFNAQIGVNPYLSWAKVLDCGDIPVSPFDNALALQQLESAFVELLGHKTPEGGRPRLVTLGGDHSIALAALRALNQQLGEKVAVLHFDAHLDTWLPEKYPAYWPGEQQKFTHGTMFALAKNESLLLPSVHAGIRTRLSGTDFGDYEDDTKQEWYRIEADEIDEAAGVQGVIDRILGQLKGKKVYLSVDIDVLDPGFAPGTGTPEPGGWTTRELMKVMRAVARNLELVGVDIVEVAPAYDNVGETTALAAAQVVFEVVSGMVWKGVQERKVLESEKVKDEL